MDRLAGKQSRVLVMVHSRLVVNRACLRTTKPYSLFVIQRALHIRLQGAGKGELQV